MPSRIGTKEDGQAVTRTRTRDDGPGPCVPCGKLDPPRERLAKGRSGRLCDECIQTLVAGYARLFVPSKLKRS